MTAVCHFEETSCNVILPTRWNPDRRRVITGLCGRTDGAMQCVADCSFDGCDDVYIVDSKGRLTGNGERGEGESMRRGRRVDNEHGRRFWSLGEGEDALAMSK